MDREDIMDLIRLVLAEEEFARMVAELFGQDSMDIGGKSAYGKIDVTVYDLLRRHCKVDGETMFDVLHEDITVEEKASILMGGRFTV